MSVRKRDCKVGEYYCYRRYSWDSNPARVRVLEVNHRIRGVLVRTSDGRQERIAANKLACTWEEWKQIKQRSKDIHAVTKQANEQAARRGLNIRTHSTHSEGEIKVIASMDERAFTEFLAWLHDEGRTQQLPSAMDEILESGR